MSKWVIRSLVLSVLLAVVVACSAGGGDGGGGIPGLNISVSPQTLTIVQGDSQEFTVTATPSGGFSGTLSAAASFAPATTGIQIGPLTDWLVSGDSPLQRVLTLSVAADVLAGDYTATVSFLVDGAEVAKAVVSFTVTTAPVVGDGELRIATGGGFVLLLDTSGQLWAWGNNYNGTLTLPVNKEYGAENHSAVPVRVSGLPEGLRILDVAASARAAFALLADGSVWSWGDGGILGRWNTSGRDPVPGPVSFEGVDVLHDIAWFAAGSSTAFAWRGPLGLWSWGQNDHFQMGTSEMPYYSTDTPHASLTGLAAGGIEQLSVGRYHGILRLAGGTALTWGAGWGRTLGDGMEYESDFATPDPVMPQFASPVVDVSAGADHSVVLLEDGTVWSWGYNRFISELLGHDGDGWSPGEVLFNLPEGRRIVDVAAGDVHSLALVDDGTVLAWGGSHSGQLGDGNDTDSATPVEVILPRPAVAIYTSSDARFSLALLDDDSLWGWGSSSSGVLPGWDPDSEDLNQATVATPVQVIADVHAMGD